MTVAERLALVQARIGESARQAGRRPQEVTLVAISKQQPIDAVFTAHDLGIRDFGENTAQGLLQRAQAFAESGRSARWHFVGKLQRNKVPQILHLSPLLVHSVDREQLAAELSRRAPPGGVAVLVQVNLGREPQKGGIAPEEAVRFACETARRPGLLLRGLMGIPPAGEDAAPHFALLRELSAQLRTTSEGREAVELSMGMSGDYPMAIRYGATLVRVGTALFGERPLRAHSRGEHETEPH